MSESETVENVTLTSLVQTVKNHRDGLDMFISYGLIVPSAICEVRVEIESV